MKLTTILLSVIIFTSSFLISCNNSSDQADLENNSTNSSEEKATSVESGSKVICLFTQVSVWKTPSTKQWKSHVFLGEEMVYQGETVIDSITNPKQKSKYYKVQLSDGEIAWINAYHSELEGTAGVCIKDINTYKRPNDIAITEDKLEPLSFVVVKEIKDDKWIKLIVPNIEKWSKSTIWIKNEGISQASTEIGAASIYYKIMNKKGEETVIERLEKILELIESYDDTSVYSLIQNELIEANAEIAEDEEGNSEDIEEADSEEE